MPSSTIALTARIFIVGSAPAWLVAQRSAAALSVQLLQAIADLLRRASAARAGQIRRNGGLGAWHQVSQLLLSKP